jgi:hypothetical protein
MIEDIHLGQAINIKELMRGNVLDFSKLRIQDDEIHTFIYQQDGSKQPMIYANTFSNRVFVSWLQIHDRA